MCTTLRTVALQLVLLLLCSAALCADPGLVKIVVRNRTPGLDPDSFGASPRTIYRQGTGYARVEEPPSIQDGVHLVILRVLADSWQLELNRKAAVHRGGMPTDVCVPIYTGLASLEFGRELEFMRQYEVEPEPIKLPDGQPGVRYGARTKELLVELLVRKQNGLPYSIEFRNPKGKVLMRILYVEYRRGLPPQPDLFTVPENFTVREGN